MATKEYNNSKHFLTITDMMAKLTAPALAACAKAILLFRIYFRQNKFQHNTLKRGSFTFRGMKDMGNEVALVCGKRRRRRHRER